MIEIPFFNGTINYQSYNEIVERIEKFDRFFEIGKDESGEYEMYLIELGSKDKPVIFMMSSIHGTEWHPTQYTLDFMEQIRDNTFPDKEFRDFLLNNFQIVFIPVVNPYGLDNNEDVYLQFGNPARYNFNGVDMNRDYYSFTQKESVNVARQIDYYEPFAFLDMHMFQPDYGSASGRNLIIANSSRSTEKYRNEWVQSLEKYSNQEMTVWYNPITPDPQSGLARRYASRQTNPYTPETLAYITELVRPARKNGEVIFPLSLEEIYKYGMANVYLFLKTSIKYYIENFKAPQRTSSSMYVKDYEGNEYALQATSTNEGETNGNQSFSAMILPTKVNKAFINDIDKLWTVVDHDDVEHKIIYLRKKGEGKSLTVEVKGIPLFFDVLDNDRIYERYDEHMTAQLAFNRIFEGTGFTFVLGGTFAAVEWEGFGDGETKLETFQRALNRYKCEFRIVGKTVYLETLIGNDTNHQYRHRLNASNIVQEIDASEMWTYAKGYGDYGDGGGGEDWQNAKLTREYTSPLASILGIRHAPPIKNGNITTRAQMDSQLKTLVDESLKISVTADIHDLRKQNYSIAQSELGDRVFLIDERIGLNDEVRIVYRSITRNWKGDVLDVNYTFGTQSIVKRHQSKLNTAIKDITSLLEGKIQLPYSVLDDAVKNATKALQDAQTQLIFSDNGILAVDKNNPNLVTLFNSAGIGVSKDGGATFGQALTGQGLNVDYVYTGTMLADYIAGGILASLNGRTVFNLNDGILEMESTEFRLGGGADIHFLSPNNRLYYERSDGSITRTSGLGVGNALNNQYPVVWMGTTGTTRGNFSPVDDRYFTGFIANTNRRTVEDGVGNSSIGELFDVRNLPVSYNYGFRFDLRGSKKVLRGLSAGSYDYELGESVSPFNALYLRNRMYADSDLEFRNRSNTSKGWRFETSESGNGDAITLRGLNTGSHNYQIGSDRVPSRILNIYLRYNPDVSSDERLKTSFENVDIDFAKRFLEVSPKRYKYKLTNADLSGGIKGSNPYQFGFIAQDIEKVFKDNDIDLRFESLVSTGSDGFKSMQYEQIHALHHRLLQDLYKRVEELENGAG